jgi:methyl-accepting chemotaxis protein
MKSHNAGRLREVRRANERDTSEIARNVQQASAGTNEVSSNINSVTEVATITGAAAGQVLSSAGELWKQSEALRPNVDTFIAKVRAA